MEKKKIIMVDDNQANLTACKQTLKDLYEIYPAPSAEKMFEILERIIPDLILLDVEMPDTNGYEALTMLKGIDAYKDIPVIFLSAMDDSESEMEGLDLGAVDYIHKPFVGRLLIRRIGTHISLIEGKRELQELNRTINELLMPTIDEPEKTEQETEEEAIMELLTKEDILVRMGHEIRTPLNAIIKNIEAAIKSNEIEKIKHFLGKADVETRLIAEILDDIFDIS